MLPVFSSAQMLRTLSDMMNEMKAYIRSGKVDFTDPDQVEGAISYYNGLPRWRRVPVNPQHMNI
jgi:hypothetical protein